MKASFLALHLVSTARLTVTEQFDFKISHRRVDAEKKGKTSLKTSKNVIADTDADAACTPTTVRDLNCCCCRVQTQLVDWFPLSAVALRSITEALS